MVFPVTHLVTSVNGAGTCARTLKYLLAILAGKWVVPLSCKWSFYVTVREIVYTCGNVDDRVKIVCLCTSTSTPIQVGSVGSVLRAQDLATDGSCVRLRFGTLPIPFTPLCHCLLVETLKDVAPFYLVYILK